MSETAVRRITDESSEVKGVVPLLISTADLMLDVSAWLMMDEVRELDYEESPLGRTTEPFGKAKIFSNVFDVSITREKDGVFDISRISLEINSLGDRYVIFLHNEWPLAPVAVYAEGAHKLFPYPPRSFESILFFLLNPKIATEAGQILENIDASEEATTAHIDFQTMMKNIPANLEDVEIEYERRDLLIEEAEIRFSSNPAFKTLQSFYAYENMDTEVKLYKVSLYLNDYLTYTFDPDDNNIAKSLGTLLEKMVPVRELSEAKKILQNVETALLRAYVIKNAMKKLDG